MKQRVILIDDEPLARSIVISFLKSYTDFEIIAECNDGFEGVKAISNLKPNLIILDIQMPKITGFEMLELLTELPHVIFTTAFDQYAIKAFESNAIDYLLKPYNKERFDQAIQKYLTINQKEIAPQVIQHINNNSERIVIKNGNDIKIISTQDVCCIEAYDDYVKIYTADKCHVKKSTLTHYENILPKNSFFRVHRSFIINTNYLTKIELLDKNSYLAILKNNTKIPVSRTIYPKLKQLLGI